MAITFMFVCYLAALSFAASLPTAMDSNTVADSEVSTPSLLTELPTDALVTDMGFELDDNANSTMINDSSESLVDAGDNNSTDVTTVIIDASSITTDDGLVVETISYTAMPETTPAVTKPSHIKNFAVAAVSVPFGLIIALPICARYLLLV